MKRRNADCGKLRRPLKRNKITDSFYGSMFMYVKFLLVWLLILLADFILEFRFEYLWPFWLLLRSVYDSFKYQGLAFSVFFVCIALTSDMICFLFIPVHWLFFAASTYVWVQYVWHTDKGVCLPTVSLWLLFVYIEASVRLKELKSLPFHLDLCRPFASHCIGYPMVTLGFGFKSYVGYRMRQRKQKEVAKENEFYMQLVQEALPPEQNCIAAISEKSSTVRSHGDSVPNGVSPSKRSPLGGHHGHSHSNGSVAGSGGSGHHRNTDSSRFSEVDPREAKKQLLVNTGTALDRELEYMENHLHKRSSINDFDESLEMLDRDKSYKANGVVTSKNVHNTGNAAQTSRWSVHVVTVPTNAAHHHVKDNEENATINSANHNHNQHQAGSPQSATAPSVSVSSGGSGRKAKNVSLQACGKEVSAANNVAGGGQKDEHVLRLEADIKRLKADLQASRQCEQDLRSQINSLLNGERLLKSELAHLQQDNDTLQAKLHGLVTARQQDKQTVATLEKKLQEEKRYRSSCEAQLVAERKAVKRLDDANAARVAAASSANTVRIECTESCKQIRRDLENDLKQLRRDIKMSEDRRRQAEREAQSLHQYKDAHNDTEVLMSALSAMQDKHAHLENSLSAETRVKLDLFSALGESTRQNEILQAQLMQKEKEIDELKSKMAEVMAVLPHSAFPPVSFTRREASPETRRTCDLTGSSLGSGPSPPRMDGRRCDAPPAEPRSMWPF